MARKKKKSILDMRSRRELREANILVTKNSIGVLDVDTAWEHAKKDIDDLFDFIAETKKGKKSGKEKEKK